MSGNAEALLQVYRTFKSSGNTKSLCDLLQPLQQRIGGLAIVEAARELERGGHIVNVVKTRHGFPGPQYFALGSR